MLSLLFLKKKSRKMKKILLIIFVITISCSPKQEIVNTEFNIQLIKSDNPKSNLIFLTVQYPA